MPHDHAFPALVLALCSLAACADPAPPPAPPARVAVRPSRAPAPPAAAPEAPAAGVREGLPLERSLTIAPPQRARMPGSFRLASTDPR